MAFLKKMSHKKERSEEGFEDFLLKTAYNTQKIDRRM